MNIIKKEDKSTTPKIEKINSSETDLLKNSNDKLLDLITKEKITKSDLNGKIISDITSNEEEEEEEESNDDDYEDDDEENIKIEKKKIEIKKTTASEVLGQENLESKENSIDFTDEIYSNSISKELYRESETKNEFSESNKV